MKRLLFFVVGLLFAIPTFAQIKIGAKHDASIDIASARVNTIILRYGYGDFYIVGKTNNRFDDPVIITLGSDTDKALSAFDSFLSLYEYADGEWVALADADNTKYLVYKHGKAGKGSLSFKAQGEAQAGFFAIHRYELVNLKTALLEYMQSQTQQ